MKTKKKQPVINMESIHLDYNFLSEFVHTQETFDNGLVSYSNNLFERLDATIWDHLDAEDQSEFELAVTSLKTLIDQVLYQLENQAKQAVKTF